MKTRALIIIGGANDCFYGAALSNAVLAEQARLGKDCPFTVVAIVGEFEIHYRAISHTNKSSLSSQIARGCVAWKKRILHLDQILKKEISCFQQCDLSPAASHFIIFECLDESTLQIDSTVCRMFGSIFLNYMTKKIPSIAIQSHCCNHPNHLVELATRNIPILLIDSVERAFTIKNPISLHSKTQLARESNLFPNIPFQVLRKIEIRDNFLTDDGRKKLLEIAFEMIERQWNTYIEHGTTNVLNTASLSFFHSVLTLGSELSTENSKTECLSLGERIRELDRFARANKESQKSTVNHEFVTKVLTFLQTRLSALDSMSQLSKVEKWLEDHDESLNDLIPGAIEHKDELKKQCEEIQKNNGLSISPTESETWLTQFDILTNSHFHSGSIFDIDDLKHILGMVAKTDRLPASNSLEALKTLQDAWDHVEIYHEIANHYKLITKVVYLTLLGIGIAVTVFSLCSTYLESKARYIIIALSFASTSLVSYITFINPAIKWQQLRMAALSIESNIWTFRTRAGDYRINDNEEENSQSF